MKLTRHHYFDIFSLFVLAFALVSKDTSLMAITMLIRFAYSNIIETITEKGETK